LRARYNGTTNTKALTCPPIASNPQFLAGNYRGTLQEYCMRRGFWLHFYCKKERAIENKRSKYYWVCTCIVDFSSMGEVTATVEAKKRRQSAQLASLAVINKMELVSGSDLMRSFVKKTSLHRQK